MEEIGTGLIRMGYNTDIQTVQSQSDTIYIYKRIMIEFRTENTIQSFTKLEETHLHLVPRSGPDKFHFRP